ncbi:uncharacterized protein G2W53_009767 [Senna tora]|uniref:Uncharacterized protein n=1 Tax=Senna tora TaxID=362788 RepID=A0A834WYS1_9FABA|nr:uncharacterized protein G2W53_009767 [Senna tora]
MVGHDPRSPHALTTPIGTSNPLRFANTTRTDVFNSLAQQVFCPILREGFEIRPQFFVRNTVRHDARSSHAVTTSIGASNPLRFTNTTRTDVFNSLAQQVFCFIIREGLSDPTAISHPEYGSTCYTLLPCQDDSNWSIKSTPVREYNLNRRV